jgi:formamidase
MIAKVKPGDEFRVECVDWTGGQIFDDDNATDVRDVNLTKVHYLSGPIGVEGAEPGDLLVVDLLDVGVLPESAWGFTGIFAKENGGGFLTEHFPDARKACWHFSGSTPFAHIPGVEFAGITHPGTDRVPAVAGAARHLEQARESELFATDPDRVPPLCALPYAETAHMGAMKGAAKAAAKEGVRTVPPREHGGNCDIKNLSRGSKVYFPVYVKGAGLSMGDIHFSQGDGEITFCGAIEMAGYLDLRVSLIKGGMKKYGIVNPIFQPSPVEPKYTRYLIFEGISVDEGQAVLPRRPCRLSARLPQCHRVPEEVRVTPASRPTRSSAPPRSKATSAASWISRTPAPRSTCRPRSSRSTSNCRSTSTQAGPKKTTTVGTAARCS